MKALVLIVLFFLIGEIAHAQLIKPKHHRYKTKDTELVQSDSISIGIHDEKFLQVLHRLSMRRRTGTALQLSSLLISGVGVVISAPYIIVFGGVIYVSGQIIDLTASNILDRYAYQQGLRDYP